MVTHRHGDLHVLVGRLVPLTELAAVYCHVDVVTNVN